VYCPTITLFSDISKAMLSLKVAKFEGTPKPINSYPPKTLEFSMTPAVRSQNIRVPIMSISANIYGKDILWPWLKKHWKRLVKKFGVGNPLANRIVASVGGVIDDKQEDDVRIFFKKNPMPGTERILEQTLERVRIRSKFLRCIKKEFT